MKRRSLSLAFLALFFLAQGASASQVRPQVRSASQVRSLTQVRPATASRQVKTTPAGRAQYGSVERTKLLTHGRGQSQSTLVLGSADRRALLTTGKAVQQRSQPGRNRR